MTKESVMAFRDKYKGMPCIYILDNEHNFFDNVDDQFPTIWNDAKEEVTFIQSNQEFAGTTSIEYPYTITVSNYEHIQNCRLFATMKDVVELLKEHKGDMSQEVYDYSIKLAGNASKRTRPKHDRYYQD